MIEDDMVEVDHRLSGHEFEQTPRGGEGQGSLVCCSPWGHKELDMTERLKNNKKFIGRTDAEAEAPELWLPDAESQVTGKDPDTRKD